MCLKPSEPDVDAFTSLYGFVCSQMLTYIARSRKDPLWLRSSVSIFWSPANAQSFIFLRAGGITLVIDAGSFYSFSELMRHLLRFMDTAAFGLHIHAIYHYSVDDFGKAEDFAYATP